MILPALRRILPWILVLGVAGGVGMGFAGGHGFDVSLLHRTDLGLLLLAAGLAFVPWAMDSVRLAAWARVLGCPLAPRQALRVVLGSVLGSAVTPTAVGGLPVKLSLLVDEGVPAGRGLSLSMLKSLEDAAFFALALPVAFLLVGPTRPTHLAGILDSWSGEVQRLGLVAAVVLVVLLLAGLLLPWIPALRRDGERPGLRWPGRRWVQLRHWIRDFRRSWRLLRNAPRGTVALSFGCTTVQWLSRYSAITVLVWSLGIPADPILFWLLQWVVFTTMVLVPTPGAAGGAEAIFALVYGPLLPPSAVGWLVMGWRLLTFYFLLLTGALAFSWLEARRKKQRIGSGCGAELD